MQLKFYLKTATPLLLYIVYDCFPSLREELSSSENDHIVYKNHTIFNLTIHGKSFLILVTDHTIVSWMTCVLLNEVGSELLPTFLPYATGKSHCHLSKEGPLGVVQIWGEED